MTAVHPARLAAGCCAAVMLSSAAFAQAPQNICPTVKALTGPVPQRSVSFRFAGAAGVALVLKGGSQFAPNPETCELDDTLGIECRWKFSNWEAAQQFYESMLVESRGCLRLPLNDESEGVDNTSAWKTIRKASARGGAFELELTEYEADHYVELTIDPVEFQTAVADEH